LNDPVNGDQLQQKEHRNVIGYNGIYQFQKVIGSLLANTEVGIGVRYDKVNDIELSHTKDKFILLNRMAFGNITETNFSAYINESIHLTEKLSFNAGLRADAFINHYTDHLKSDSLFKAKAAIVSPKLNLAYQYNQTTQFYFNLGKGFHSNDTRVCVAEKGKKILPPAYAADLGTIIKPSKNLLVQFAFWYLWLDQEFVYNGDDGTPSPSGKTERKGFDFSIRYQPLSSLYIDVDINYAHGRFTEEKKV